MEPRLTVTSLVRSPQHLLSPLLSLKMYSTVQRIGWQPAVIFICALLPNPVDDRNSEVPLTVYMYQKDQFATRRYDTTKNVDFIHVYFGESKGSMQHRPTIMIKSCDFTSKPRQTMDGEKHHVTYHRQPSKELQANLGPQHHVLQSWPEKECYNLEHLN